VIKHSHIFAYLKMPLQSVSFVNINYDDFSQMKQTVVITFRSKSTAVIIVIYYYIFVIN
jgi:hypothetical protein